MTDPSFPAEILHRIIGLAAKEDDNEYSTMKTCALVCYGLSKFCQQLMFEDVQVNTTRGDIANWNHPFLRLSTAGFVKALSGHFGLSLGKAIWKLSFVISQSDYDDALALQQTLKAINHLEYLMVTQTGLKIPIEMRKLDAIGNTFKHLFELPTLYAMCISDFPVFSVGPGLKEIDLRASLPQPWEVFFKHPTTFSEHRPELESMTFHGHAIPALKRLLSSRRTDGTPVVGLSNLKRVAVHTLTNATLFECFSLASGSSVGLQEVAFMSQEIDENFLLYGGTHIYTAIEPSLKTLKRLTLDLPFTGHKGDSIFIDFGSRRGAARRQVTEKEVQETEQQQERSIYPGVF
ncbi:hypothetical protein CPB83DRAFT_908602 [Crepidotus variabilis]|uniref:Uncharacterized protein n=1 Tax=Crepidotus variabilis TaxID=179855 RepID=A0A9P6JMD7_9AGAR|nr:hypothetical protein CPB83DRAFT_908602 [Crepidotus variabilis]